MKFDGLNPLVIREELQQDTVFGHHNHGLNPLVIREELQPQMQASVAGQRLS